MAANFWPSSHFKQLLDQEEVDRVPSTDEEKGLTLEEFKHIKIHMTTSSETASISGAQIVKNGRAISLCKLLLTFAKFDA